MRSRTETARRTRCSSNAGCGCWRRNGRSSCRSRRSDDDDDNNDDDGETAVKKTKRQQRKLDKEKRARRRRAERQAEERLPSWEDRRAQSTIGYTPDGGRIVQMTPRVQEALKRQRQLFIERFGREPGPKDPVFFDPDAEGDTPQKIDPDKAIAMTRKLATLAGLDPDAAILNLFGPEELADYKRRTQ